MKIFEISKVGSKNELYPPKKIREKIGLKPGVKILFAVENKILKVKPIPNILDLLKAKELGKVSLKDLRKYRKSLTKEIEER